MFTSLTLELLLPVIVVSFGLTNCIFFYWKTARLISSLKGVYSRVNEIVAGKTYIDPQTLEQLEQYFAEQPLFSYAWTQFSETLVEFDDKTGAKIVGNTRPFAEFRTRERFLEHELSISQWRIWPGLLTAMGLLFSFILIQKGLANIRSDNPAASINVFVEELKAKFYSSIAGIGFSAFMQWEIEKRVKAVEISYNGIVDLIERKFHRSKAEDFLAPMARNISDLTDNMRLFTTSLATTIGSGVREGMSITTDRMLSAVQELHTVIEKLQNQSQQNGTELLQRLITDMNSAYKGAAQKELEGLGEVIRGLSTTLTSSTTQTGQMLDKLQGVLDSIETTMSRQQTLTDQNLQTMQSAMLQMMDQHQEATKAQSTLVRDSVDDIVIKTKSFSGELSTQFSEMLKQNQETLKAFEATRNGLTASVSAFQGAVVSTESLLQKSNAIFSDLTSAAKTSLSCQTALSKDLDILVQQGNAFTDAQLKNQQIMANFKGLFEETESTLEKLIREIATHLDSYHQQTKSQLEGHLSQFAQHMGDAATKLSGTITDLDEHLDNLGNTLGNLKQIRS